MLVISLYSRGSGLSEFRLTWAALGDTDAPVVRTMSELIAFMAICPRHIPKGAQRRR